MAAVDWTVHDAFPENTIECRCGAFYRSHSKGVSSESGVGFVIRSRKPCPACGETEDNARAVRSDPEVMTIRR